MRVALILIAFQFFSNTAWAVRPFITDDARVVGALLAQWETWIRFDEHSTQQWNMLAYGPNNRLELTLGAVFGTESETTPGNNTFTYAMPLLQGKYLFKPYEPNKMPGYSIVAGTFLPGGRGEFVAPGYGAFAFGIISQSFGEGDKVLLHLNVGVNYLYLNRENVFKETWGFGTQIKTFKGFHLVGEIFSGDPYVPGTGLSYQAGFRHFINDDIQIDGTFGEGLEGDNRLPFWWSVGVRLVTHHFEKRKEKRSAESQSLRLNNPGIERSAYRAVARSRNGF